MNLKHAGYTLIEVLIGITILGILMALSATGYQSYQRGIQLNEMIQKTVGIIRDVQEESMTKSLSYTISYVAATKTFVVKDASNATIKTSKLPYGEVTSWANNITFLSRGLPQQQYQFTLKNFTRTRNIFVLTTGKVIVR